MEAVKAYEVDERPRTTLYEFENGRKEKWIGGSPAWRNNNPGNLRPAKAHLEQIGEAWGFAVFASADKGKIAMMAQLRRPLYAGLTLEQVIRKYAPPTDSNPTEAYIRYVSGKSGVGRKEIVSHLPDARLLAVVNAMTAFEGAIHGKIVVILPKKSGRYIWRTSRDEKVRAGHAVRDGKVFSFESPPEGGNPGDAYGCRCVAEPLPEVGLGEIFGK